MKKIMTSMLGLFLLFTFCACGSKPPEEQNAPAMENPVTEYRSLEELNAACGTILTHPGVMGVSGERFTSIACSDYVIAQYDFCVAGVQYTLRTAPVTEDISGYYADGKSVYGEPDNDFIAYAEADNVKLARWFNTEGQFCLSAVNANDGFPAIAEEICSLHTPVDTGGTDGNSLSGQ